MARPVPLHREEHPDLDVSGCFGCKMASVSFGVYRLKADNKGGYTQAELGRSTIEAAAKSGREISSTNRWI